MPEPPPQIYARVGGVLYLLIFALGFTLFAFPNFEVDGTAAMHAVAASESVDRNIALLAAFCRHRRACLRSATTACNIIARLHS